MREYEKLLTIKQFATIAKINKKTLIYYDEIGLFSPYIRKENNYRYYTINQIPDLEMILTLRELNMSIAEIKAFQIERNTESMISLLSIKSDEINEEIRKLKEIQSLLDDKQKLLKSINHIQLDEILLKDYKEEYLSITTEITNKTDHEVIDILLNHFDVCHTNRLFNHHIGTMIHTNELYKHHFDQYSHYFTAIKNKKKSKHLFIRPAGTYLVTYHKGDWDDLPKIYNEILNYADKNNLELIGYSYEEGLNDLTIQDMKDYITKISIQCKQKNKL